MVYVSDDKGNIPRYYFNALPSQCVTVEAEFSLEANLHPYLHVWMYMTSNRDDIDGALSQGLFACGYVPLHQVVSGLNVPIVLTDIDGRQQAIMAIKVTPAIHLKPPSSLPLPIELSEDQQSLIDVFTDEWYRPSANIEIVMEKQGYTHLMTPMGELPLICFPLMTTMMDPSYWEQGPMELYLIWNHWMYMAIKRLGYNYKELMAQNPDPNADDLDQGVRPLLRVFCEMVTLVSHGHLFVDDRSRDRGGQVVLIEWWVNLALFPNAGLVGRDCEDATGFICQLVHVFQHLPLDKSDHAHDINLRFLLRLQTLIRRYTTVVTLGTQYVGGTGSNAYMPHAFVILMESTYVDQLRSKDNHTPSYLPSLLLDTVNYIDPIWDETEWASKAYERRSKNAMLEEQFIKRHEPFRRFLKPFVLSQRLNENEQYGDISHMITINHRGQGLHWIAKQPPSLARPSCRFKVGYRLEDMMLKKATYENVQEVFSLDREEIRAFHRTMKNLPWSRMIPLGYTLEDTQVHSQVLHAYTVKRQEAQRSYPERLCFLIRTLDYQGSRKDAIDRAFRQDYPDLQQLLTYEYHVTSEISFTEITVYRGVPKSI